MIKRGFIILGEENVPSILQIVLTNKSLAKVEWDVKLVFIFAGLIVEGKGETSTGLVKKGLPWGSLSLIIGKGRGEEVMGGLPCHVGEPFTYKGYVMNYLISFFVWFYDYHFLHLHLVDLHDVRPLSEVLGSQKGLCERGRGCEQRKSSRL